MTHPGPNGNPNGRVPASGYVSQTQAAAAATAAPQRTLQEVVKDAIKRERVARQKAIGADDRLYPRPLPAGSQAYLNPRIWERDDADAFDGMLDLMAQLEAERRDR